MRANEEDIMIALCGLCFGLGLLFLIAPKVAFIITGLCSVWVVIHSLVFIMIKLYTAEVKEEL